MLDAKSRRYATVKGEVKTSVLRETLRKNSKHLSRRDAQKKLYIFIQERCSKKTYIYQGEMLKKTPNIYQHITTSITINIVIAIH